MHLNDTNSKITGLKHAVSLDPEYYDAHFELGKMHLFVDDAEASEHFSRCLEFNANDARAFRKRALAKRELGDVPGAIEDLSSAMALEPGDGDDFFMRANLLILIERFGDAIEDCMFGLSAKPDDPAILSTMGFAYFKLGNAKVALDKLDRCISLDPYDFEAFVIRAAIHMDFGDYDRALSDLLSSDAIRPLFGDGLFYRAKYAEASGDTKLAISDYMKYVEEEAKCGFPDIAQMQHAQRRINDLRKMKRN
jgi:tetratricopeptide (TPR) repeat protein